MLLGVVTGVKVFQHPNADESTKRAVIALVGILNKVGIEAAVEFWNAKNPKSNTIMLNIGTKH